MHSHRIYNGSSTHLGFCEPITKNEKIEKESELNGNRPDRVSRLHDGPDCAGKTRLGSATGNVPGVASAIPENGLRCPRNREDAEGALQDALISAYKRMRSFEGGSAPKTWLTRVVLNAALMIRRRRKSTHIEFVTESLSADGFSKIARIADTRPNPEKQYAATETFEFARALIDGLSPGLRQAFTMTYLDENRAKEAGAKLDMNITTFKSRLFRARKELVDQARTVVNVRSVSR
jgi:RNA polymerase sigma-70 factor, ECF subfamily